VGDVEFTTTWSVGSTATHFHIRKTTEMAQALVDFVVDHRDANIVELGVAQGGSTALVALLGAPRRLVAIEYDAEPVVALADFLERERLTDRIHAHYGVDQADRERVAAIVDDELGREPIDLVIDDASHLLAETTSSFETLFPRLRPGGWFLIEDWAWQQQVADRLYAVAAKKGETPDQVVARKIDAAVGDPNHPEHQMASTQFAAKLDAVLRGPSGPDQAATEAEMAAEVERMLADADHPRHEEAVRKLAAMQADGGAPVSDGPEAPTADSRHPESDEILLRLIYQLVMSQIARPDVISEIVVDQWWVKVRRGPAPLDPRSFRVADLFRDHFGLLTS
jgi:predicted O-methyltransferase YrrM